jgi:peroxiredoxin
VTELHEALALTVQGNLDALQAQRNADWTAEQLAANAALRRRIDDGADRSRFVKVGDVVEPFVLPAVGGETVALLQLLESGPVVLLFFRFESCPACNVAMPAYRDALAPELSALGAHLVAISPQVPEKLSAIQARLGLEFLVASDPEARLIRSFGIGFAPDEEEQAQQRAAGSDLGELLGTGNWYLPYPTVVVVDQQRVVRFADVHPDWMVRTEAGAVIEAVRALG